MNRTLVLNVVGLTPAHLGPHTPNLRALAERGRAVPIRTITPAVTCSVQSTFTTGLLPSEHGCVANGWYFRDEDRVWLWRQSNRLVQGEKIWDAAKRRDQRFRCAKLFWWYNMHASVDLSVTPRPIYRADGQKLPDVYTQPLALRDELQAELGTFPLFNFWGPRADITSSAWIARCAEHVHKRHQPTLSLVYLPHLDYDLQRYGPDSPNLAENLRSVDQLCGQLIDLATRESVRVIVLSEYAILPVSGPVHIQRALREANLLSLRTECGEEHLDPGGSEAFAVADHQVAHVYVRNPQRVGEVKALLESVDGIERVLDDDGKAALGLAHPRSGELVALAKPDRWFTYYWWLQDAKAPDYARTVDIHAKPGYDPVELFLDPELPLPGLYVASRLFQRKVLRQRVLLDVVPLDASLVRGSHGRVGEGPDRTPVFITSEASLLGDREIVAAEDVKSLVLDHLFEST